MWNGKKKAVTFSFDDGVLQDKKTIAILDKYGLKATFNINSSLLGLENKLIRNNVEVNHTKFRPEEIKEVYKNHEVAGHTLTHPYLPDEQNDEEIIRQVEEDRLALEKLIGKPVVGFAYPGGGMNHNDRVASIIRQNTGVKYARTIVSTYSFDLPEDLIKLNPTVYYIEECLFDVAEKFMKTESDKPQLLYIWGHSYEMDAGYISYEKFEELCKMLSDKEDIFYGTNSEVLL